MLSTSQNVHEISWSKAKRHELKDMTKETAKHGDMDLVQLFSDGLWFKVPFSGDCDENIITYIVIFTSRDCLESWNGVLSWIVANFWIAYLMFRKIESSLFVLTRSCYISFIKISRYSGIWQRVNYVFPGAANSKQLLTKRSKKDWNNGLSIRVFVSFNEHGWN